MLKGKALLNRMPIPMHIKIEIKLLSSHYVYDVFVVYDFFSSAFDDPEICFYIKMKYLGHFIRYIR